MYFSRYLADTDLRYTDADTDMAYTNILFADTDT
jgi:hypothetical protein